MKKIFSAAILAATFGFGAIAFSQTVSPPFGGGGGGTVSSVGLVMPTNEFSVTGTPVTSSGSLATTWKSQTANQVFAAPNGSAGTPSFRTLASDDLPTVPVSKGGTNATSASGTALDNITGFSTTGILRRTGAGTYSLGTLITNSEMGANSVDTSQIVDGSISSAKLQTVPVSKGGTGATTASGTSVDNISGFSGTGLMRRTGAGAYSFGTQVGTSEIADASVTTAKLAAPASSGASWVLLGSASASGTSSIPLNGYLSSSYPVYKLTMDGIVLSSGTGNVVLQYGTGGTYYTGSNYNSMRSVLTMSGLGQEATSGGTSFVLAGAASVNGQRPLVGEVTLFSPSETNFRKTIIFNDTGYVDASTSYYTVNGQGVLETAGTAYTDVRLFSSVNILSGTIRLYGIRPN